MKTGAGALNTPPVGWPVERFIGLMDEAHGLTLSVYRELSEEQFRDSACPMPGREKSFSPEWILYNLLDHVANHRGQVALLKRLLRS